MILFSAILLGAIALETTHDQVPDTTTVGEILNLGGYNATNAANWAIGQYDSTNLSSRISAKYTKPDTGIPMTDLKSDLQQTIYGKQDALVSGTNIKTINNQSILGSGNITIEGGGSGGTSNYNLLSNKPKINNIELVGNKSLTDIGAQKIIADYTTTNAAERIAADSVTNNVADWAMAGKEEPQGAQITDGTNTIYANRQFIKRMSGPAVGYWTVRALPDGELTTNEWEETRYGWYGEGTIYVMDYGLVFDKHGGAATLDGYNDQTVTVTPQSTMTPTQFELKYYGGSAEDLLATEGAVSNLIESVLSEIPAVTNVNDIVRGTKTEIPPEFGSYTFWDIGAMTAFSADHSSFSYGVTHGSLGPALWIVGIANGSGETVGWGYAETQYPESSAITRFATVNDIPTIPAAWPASAITNADGTAAIDYTTNNSTLVGTITETAPTLTGAVYDFDRGTNFTLRLYQTLTNVIDRMGGSVTNAPSFE